MTDHTELVKALRSASTVSTAWEKLMRDAATAIEELDAEETRLLLITSELQDKVMALQAQLPKRGEWKCSYPEIEPNPMFMYGICSICGFEQSISNKLNYCPNCGADMREKMEVQE